MNVARGLMLCVLLQLAALTAEAGEPRAMIEPQIAGTWRVAEVYKEDKEGKLTPYSLDGFDWEYADESVMPIGLVVSFHGDRVPETGEPLSIIELEALDNVALCKHKSFGWRTLDCADFPQKLIQEFSLWFERRPSELKRWKPVGAGKHDLLYQVRLNGSDGWFGEFYVAKDNKTMWTQVYFREVINGRGIPGTVSGGFQRWVRLK